MPRVTSNGRVTIPKAVRDALGIEPGDEIAFETGDSGDRIRKKEPASADGEDPTAANGEDPFENYRGSADGDDTMSARMRRLRGEYPRDTEDETGIDDSTGGV